MSCQLPNTIHWTCNLPSHLIYCNNFHRSTYMGIILQVYKVNYILHMPEQKTRQPPESKWQHYHDLYSHAVHIQPTFPSCCWCSSKYRIVVRLWTSMYRCRIYHLWSCFCEMLETRENSQFLWDAGNWGKFTITSSHSLKPNTLITKQPIRSQPEV